LIEGLPRESPFGSCSAVSRHQSLAEFDGALHAGAGHVAAEDSAAADVVDGALHRIQGVAVDLESVKAAPRPLLSTGAMVRCEQRYGSIRIPISVYSNAVARRRATLMPSEEGSVMNVRAETVAKIRGVERTRRSQPVEQTDLHAARGILLAVGLSLLGWVVVLAVMLA